MDEISTLAWSRLAPRNYVRRRTRRISIQRLSLEASMTSLKASRPLPPRGFRNQELQRNTVRMEAVIKRPAEVSVSIKTRNSRAGEPKTP